MDYREFNVVGVGIVLIVLLTGIAWGIAQPYFESSSWNRLTGGNASYWDAIWVELRVDCSNSK